MKLITWTVLVPLALTAWTRSAKAGFVYTSIAVPGSVETQLNGINDSSQIVGTASVFTGQGFLLSNGNYTPLYIPGVFTTASGINAAGQIVGYSTIDHNSFSGFLLSNGIYTTLSVPGAYATVPQGSTPQDRLWGILTVTAPHPPHRLSLE
jgi:probable HAF family extracellular repeat protein